MDSPNARDKCTGSLNNDLSIEVTRALWSLSVDFSMIFEELNNLETKLAQSPLDWERRLDLIQAHVIRDQLDEAKRLVRESPDEAGPAPPEVQYRLHRLMTEGRSAAEEFAQGKGQESAIVSDELNPPPGKLIEVEVISIGGDAPVDNIRVEEDLSAGEIGIPGERVDATETPTRNVPESIALDDPVSENAMKMVDSSVRQRDLDNSRFVIESIEEIKSPKHETDTVRKASALGFAALVHVILIVILGAIVMADSRPEIPMIVAINSAEDQVLDVPRKRIEQIKRSKHSAASARTTMVITSSSLSPVTMPEIDVSDVSYLPTAMIGFGTGTGSGFSGEGFGDGERSGMIGGMKIKTRRLGVVLDVSGSMDEQIRAVRREIRKNFSSATVVEVVGCTLDWREGDPSFDLKKTKGSVRIRKNADSVVDAVAMLIAAANVDAIFWFSDLMDSQTEEGEQRLSHLLGTQFGSNRRPVKFYVQSVDQEPTTTLAGIVKRSGGATKVESLK